MEERDLTSRVKDISSAAAAFSQVTGVLGGFGITIVVLALSPSTFPNENGKDWIVGVVLLAAAIYITASGILANAMTIAAVVISAIAFWFAIINFLPIVFILRSSRTD